ncbi:MAG: hypothetical protein K9L98_03650 [Candidatus Pacebacteria bacterium]|nr:hypothetical protein [Candidatus Paceibacterota bacterium]MCF7863072.1 hypothetical protein [Candidatus Paceibacterota bacterium]
MEGTDPEEKLPIEIERSFVNIKNYIANINFQVLQLSRVNIIDPLESKKIIDILDSLKKAIDGVQFKVNKKG